MGPYATYGLAGAGAGLLFLLYGAQTGGSVSTPGTSCKHGIPWPRMLALWEVNAFVTKAKVLFLHLSYQSGPIQLEHMTRFQKNVPDQW